VRWTRPSGAADGDEAADGAGEGVGIEFEPGAGQRELELLVDRVRSRDPELVSRLVRVLVVEDNPHVAQLIRDGLRGSERRSFADDLVFNFRTASNGREAIELLGRERFDALIIDIYLPVLDGPNVIAHVRAEPTLARMPVIAVSAGGEHAREAALAAGADFFLHKPMRLRQVIETMRQLMAIG
jgi:CheY-like chemotaxis protein